MRGRARARPRLPSGRRDQPFDDQGLLRPGADGPAFCIGGSELYREALNIADTMYLTEINRDFEGDARFPDIVPQEWQETEREAGPADPSADFAYSFVTWRRRTTTGVTH